ncbi:MAG: hypothetical protein PUI88_03500 [Prevotella sp.]|nr:hypothetical protein [Prevotella sp.]
MIGQQRIRRRSIFHGIRDITVWRMPYYRVANAATPCGECRNVV